MRVFASCPSFVRETTVRTTEFERIAWECVSVTPSSSVSEMVSPRMRYGTSEDSSS